MFLLKVTPRYFLVLCVLYSVGQWIKFPPWGRTVGLVLLRFEPFCLESHYHKVQLWLVEHLWPKESPRCFGSRHCTCQHLTLPACPASLTRRTQTMSLYGHSWFNSHQGTSTYIIYLWLYPPLTSVYICIYIYCWIADQNRRKRVFHGVCIVMQSIYDVDSRKNASIRLTMIIAGCTVYSTLPLE